MAKAKGEAELNRSAHSVSPEILGAGTWLQVLLAILGPCWDHLGAILGPSWGHLGQSWPKRSELTNDVEALVKEAETGQTYLW